MGWIHSSLVVSVLTMVSFVNASLVTDPTTSTVLGTGCTFGGAIATQTGFIAKFYEFFGDYSDSSYLANGYTTGVAYETQQGFGSPGDSFFANPDSITEFTGYFMAPDSGLYVLHMSISPPGFGSVMAWLGSEMAFECCHQQIPSDTVDGYSMFVTDSAEHVAYFYLDAVVFYPMRIVNAAIEPVWFELSMDTPSGSITHNWSNYIVQISDVENEACFPAGGDTTSTTSESTAATLYWTGSNTFTSTYLFITTDSSSVVHVVAESALVIPEQTVVTTDVSSTTTVVTEFTAIDTTPGATPYLTTGNVVLVPRSSAGSNTSSIAAASNTSSGATSNASSGTDSFNNSSSTGSSNTSSSATKSSTISGTSSSKITLGTTSFDTTSSTASFIIASGTTGSDATASVIFVQGSSSFESGAIDAYITTVVTQYTTVSCDLYWSGEYEFTTTFVETTTDVSGNPCVVTNFGKVKTGTPTVVGVGVSTVTTIGGFTTVDTTSGTSQYVTTGTVIVIPVAVSSASRSTSATSVPLLEDISNSGSILSCGYTMLVALSLCLLI